MVIKFNFGATPSPERRPDAVMEQSLLSWGLKCLLDH